MLSQSTEEPTHAAAASSHVGLIALSSSADYVFTWLDVGRETLRPAGRQSSTHFPLGFEPDIVLLLAERSRFSWGVGPGPFFVIARSENGGVHVLIVQGREANSHVCGGGTPPLVRLHARATKQRAEFRHRHRAGMRL